MRNLALAVMLILSIAAIGCTQRAKPINQSCPVMGGEVDPNTPHAVEYQGQTIGFCCAGCVSEFEKNPEKYMSKVEAEKSANAPHAERK